MRQFVQRTLNAHRGAALTALLGLALALTIVVPSTAGAVDNWGDSAKKSCSYQGKEYGHGSVIRQINGHYYRCEDGVWMYDPWGPLQVPSQEQFIEPVDEAPEYDSGATRPNVIDEAAPAVLAP